MRQKRILSILIILAILGSGQLSAKEIPFSVAPDFKLMDTYQDKITLSDYKDKQPVVLFFWATWSPVCEKELTMLNSMYSVLAKEGIETLAINVGDLQDTVDDFVKNLNLAYRVLLDKDARVSNLFQAQVPTYILIDRKGTIVFKDTYFPQGTYKDLVLD